PVAEAQALQGELKGPFCGTKGLLDVGAFEGPALANAAVAADWPDASTLMAYVKKRLDDKVGVESASALAGLGPPACRGSSLATLAHAASPEGLNGEGGSEIAGFAGQVLTTGFEALAKLIADRAQREVVEYFLETMRKDLCLPSTGKDPKATKDPTKA